MIDMKGVNNVRISYLGIYLDFDSSRALDATFVVTNVCTRTPPRPRKGKGASNPCPPEKKRRARNF